MRTSAKSLKRIQNQKLRDIENSFPNLFFSFLSLRFFRPIWYIRVNASFIIPRQKICEINRKIAR